MFLRISAYIGENLRVILLLVLQSSSMYHIQLAKRQLDLLAWPKTILWGTRRFSEASTKTGNLNTNVIISFFVEAQW